MVKQETLAKIETDLQLGCKQRAIVRLRSLVASYPYDLTLRYQLAEIYYQAGFMDMAGLYWLLHEPTDERMKQAIAVYQTSVNHSAQQMLKDIAFHGDQNRHTSELETYALNQLHTLNALKAKANGESNPPKPPKSVRSAVTDTALEKGCLLILLVCLLIFIWGFIDIIRSVFPWLSEKIIP